MWTSILGSVSPVANNETLDVIVVYTNDQGEAIKKLYNFHPQTFPDVESVKTFINQELQALNNSTRLYDELIRLVGTDITQVKVDAVPIEVL